MRWIPPITTSRNTFEWPAADFGKARLARNGTIVSDTISDDAIVQTTATGNERMKSPAPSGNDISGTNASSSVAVQPITAMLISDTPAIAASRGASPSRRRLRDVLGHDDRIVNQQSKRQHEPRNRQLIQRVAEELQRDDTHRQRQRNRHHHDERRPIAQRQQRQQHEPDRNHEIARQRTEPMFDRHGLIETTLQLNVGRQARLEFIDLRADAVDHVEYRGAELRACGHEQRAASVETRDVAALVIGPGDIGNVADGDYRSFVRPQHDTANLIEAVERTRRIDVEASPAGFDRADRRIQSFARQRVGHRRQRQTIRGKSIEIGRNAYFGGRHAPDFGVLDARARVRSRREARVRTRPSGETTRCR